MTSLILLGSFVHSLGPRWPSLTLEDALYLDDLTKKEGTVNSLPPLGKTKGTIKNQYSLVLNSVVWFLLFVSFNYIIIKNQLNPDRFYFFSQLLILFLNLSFIPQCIKGWHVKELPVWWSTCRAIETTSKRILIRIFVYSIDLRNVKLNYLSIWHKLSQSVDYIRPFNWKHQRGIFLWCRVLVYTDF